MPEPDYFYYADIEPKIKWKKFEKEVCGLTTAVRDAYQIYRIAIKQKLFI